MSPTNVGALASSPEAAASCRSLAVRYAFQIRTVNEAARKKTTANMK